MTLNSGFQNFYNLHLYLTPVLLEVTFILFSWTYAMEIADHNLEGNVEIPNSNQASANPLHDEILVSHLMFLSSMSALIAPKHIWFVFTTDWTDCLLRFLLTSIKGNSFKYWGFSGGVGKGQQLREKTKTLIVRVNSLCRVVALKYPNL